VLSPVERSGVNVQLRLLQYHIFRIFPAAFVRDMTRPAP
jgi:hypothetical protein